MQKRIAIFIFLCAMAIAVEACFRQAQNGEKEVAQPDWQVVDAGPFTVSLPQEWQFNKLQGIDSQIGEFVGDGARLSFDFGWYSNPGADDDDENHFVNYEMINGRKAKLVTPKSGGTITGVYFRNLESRNSLSISGENLTPAQQETALAIFRTIQIKAR